MPPRNAEKTSAAIRRAGIRLFYRQGYAATTLRDIASEVGIQVGSVYNHIAAKEDLLFSIMNGVMQDLLDATSRALESYVEPEERLQAMIETHVRFHGERADEVFIGNSELRGLSAPRRAVIVQLRDDYERLFRTALEDGVSSGVFHTADSRLVTYAILAMATHVATWYQPGGRRSLEEIASIYSDFALRALTNAESSVTLGATLMPQP
jgi:AcrR family transcriptional regulator